jgi:hypothetical protein
MNGVEPMSTSPGPLVPELPAIPGPFNVLQTEPEKKKQQLAVMNFLEGTCTVPRTVLWEYDITLYQVTKFCNEHLQKSGYYEQLRKIVEPSMKEFESPGKLDTSARTRQYSRTRAAAQVCTNGPAAGHRSLRIVSPLLFPEAPCGQRFRRDRAGLCQGRREGGACNRRSAPEAADQHLKWKAANLGLQIIELRQLKGESF